MLDQEIKSIIEKNLPAQVGEVLQKKLAQADADAASIEGLRKTLEQKEATIASQAKKLQKAGDVAKQQEALDKLEQELKEKERNLKISTLEYQLTVEKDKTEFTKSVALGLVRNTEYRKNLFDSKDQPYIDAQGYHQYGNVTVKADETSRAE